MSLNNSKPIVYNRKTLPIKFGGGLISPLNFSLIFPHISLVKPNLVRIFGYKNGERNEG